MINRKRLIYRLNTSLPMIIAGKRKKNLIQAYWGWSENNFGDLLTPLLLKHYGLSPVHAYPRKARLVGVGTLLGYINTDFDGFLLGTGTDNPAVRELPMASVIGLRGKLTQKALNLENRDIVLGDPGLLASILYPVRKEKKYGLGILPHMSELNHLIVNRWKEKFRDKAKFINVLQAPEKVIAEIDECEAILSSSLHGLIVADSLQVPNCRFIIKGDHVYEYNDFRFDDYYSVLGIEGAKIKASGEESISLILSNMRTGFSTIAPVISSLDSILKDFTYYYLNEK